MTKLKLTPVKFGNQPVIGAGMIRPPQLGREEVIRTMERNRMGICDTFFLFGSLLKSRTSSSHSGSLFCLFAYLLICISLSSLPIIPRLFLVSGESISISPNLIALMMSSLIVMAISLLTFIIAIVKPSVIVRIWWLLYPQVHLLLLSLPSVSFGFAVVAYICEHEVSLLVRSLIWLMGAMLPLYLFVSCVLFFIETDSIIHPNPVFSEWFYGTGFLLPILTSITSLFSSVACAANIGKYSTIPICASALAESGFVIYLGVKMPFMSVMTDQLLIAKGLLCTLVHIVAIILVTSSVRLRSWVISALPFVFLCIFAFLSAVTSVRRRFMVDFLHQFEGSVSQFTVDAIGLTLSSFHTERQFQWIIRESFVSGNGNVLTPRFLQYCLTAYPKSQWLLSVVVFLYAIVWGVNPTVYRVLLHLKSVEECGVVAAFILFQCIYANQQSSTEVSPMIRRGVQKCRKLLAQYAHQHSLFWSSIVNSDKTEFCESAHDLWNCASSLDKALHSLKASYPFCPLVYLELSLYNSDVRGDIRKSAENFAMYQNLSSDIGAVARFLNGYYLDGLLLMQGNSQHFEDLTPGDVFLSFRDKHEFATRCVAPPLKDSYFIMAHTYSARKQPPRLEISFDQGKLRLFQISVWLFIGLVISSLISAFYLFVKYRQYIDSDQSISELIKATIKFRSDVRSVQMTSLLVTNFKSDVFDVDLDQSFLSFILDHLRRAYDQLLRYKYFLDSRRSLALDLKIDGCDTVNCTFSWIFGSLYNLARYHELESGDTSMSVEWINAQMGICVGNMLLLSENVYQDLSELRYAKERDTRILIWHGLIFLGTVQFGIGLLLLASLVVIRSRILYRLFLIFRTVPTEVANEMSAMLNKVSGVEDVGNRRAKGRRLGCKLVSVAILALVFSFPIPLLILVPDTRMSPLSIVPLPAARMVADAQLMAFSIAYTEVYFGEGNSGSGCLLNLAHEECSECVRERSDRLGIQAVSLWMWLNVVLSFLFLALFITVGILIIRLMTAMQGFLGDIPESARNSNPVLGRIMKREEVSIAEVQELIDSAAISVNDDFCIVSSEKGIVKSCQGGWDRFLRKRPRKFNDVRHFLNEKCEGGVNEFFERGLNGESVSTSVLLGDMEVQLNISHQGSVFLLCDNSVHSEMNEEIRRMEKMVSVPIIVKSEVIERALIICVKEGCDIFDCVRTTLNRSGWELRDSRFHELLFLKRADDLGVECLRCLDVMRNLEKMIGTGRAAAGMGIVYILDGRANGFQMTRNRVFGPAYDMTRRAMKSIRPGESCVQKEIFELGGGGMFQCFADTIDAHSAFCVL